jgi:hypothetical protein
MVVSIVWAQRLSRIIDVSNPSFGMNRGAAQMELASMLVRLQQSPSPQDTTSPDGFGSYVPPSYFYSNK